MMGSLKALQEWCRIQCEHYNDVEVKDMSTSFRDGLAFCAIIHRYRPELIDFGSLSKENVYENNRLAFEVAETQLGIPALLDAEDMVSMKVPDRLSIITYVSQYYNFFNNKSQANPPSVKRPSSVGHNEPTQKRPATPLEDKVVESEPSQPAQTGEEAVAAVGRGTLSSTCAACQKHVHLVQRFLVDGKLYHRSCFRCTECRSTLLPGSYKLGSNSGALVCTHHLARHALANQNGRPDFSKRAVVGPSARIGRSTIPHTSLSDGDGEQTAPPASQTEEADLPADDSATAVTTNGADSLEKADVMEGSGETEAVPRSSSPPNPFDESDEEVEEDTKPPAKSAINGDLPSTPISQNEGASRPVPAPRRVSEPAPPPRPAPRVRLPRTGDRLTAGECQKPPIPPKPRERSRSPGSLSSGTHKAKDPPWLALVQSEPRKKKAPPPPPAGLATPPNVGSLSSLKGEGSRPSTPPAPANPFEDDEDDDEDENDEAAEEEGSGGSAIPPTVVASHPWYSITQAADATGADTPPSGGSSSRSASPGSAKSKKRLAPPRPPAGHHVLSHSQPSSCSPSPALSTESLSSGSDRSSSHPRLGGGDQEHAFTKSVSEPSICSPCDSTPPPSSSSTERLPHPSLSPSPPPMPSNASSAPATPQPSRSFGTKGAVDPPPRPPTTPSPLASGAPQSHNKRICKENPFNRKASPSPAKSKTKPPKGPRPARPPAPGHGFPLIKRKVQSDQYIPVEDIHGEMGQLEKQLDEMEQRGVELEKKLRDNPNDEDEEHMLVDWFTLIHEKHLLVRREAELVYTAKQQNLEERQADVEYELRCLLNKPDKDWTEEDKSRDEELMAELVTIIEQRNQIVNNMDQDRQREEEEDKLMEAMLKKKDFHKDPDVVQQKKKGKKFKPIKVLKRLSHKGEPGKSHSPRKEKTP
ncbi:hypothetical protein VZT92_002194 [Zoarces viviparus]|uniref:MICAL-like protein 1 n=1 Tax=Zoarces viviparus TaxID=48416 RepID=A0AAW1FXR1_ZOAVI